jgi:hypothetical protein
MSLIRRLLLTGGTALGGFVPAVAADPIPSATTPAEDAKLSRAAYSALQGEETLADLNIGVRVLAGGTAVLWGTAAPADVARAEALLKTLPGITKIVSTCDTVGAADPLVVRVEAQVRKEEKSEPAKPRPLKPEPVKPEAPSVLTPATAVAKHTTKVEKPRVALSIAREPAARLLDPLAVASPVDYAAVEKVRQSDSRFARLTFDLRDGRVVIGGVSQDPEAAWDLARKVAPLVGDRDVVIAKTK